ncbi:MAG: DUF2341 domain-containing protein, partial [Anaerolineae bacterium]|nr:DUF2341 domain-containing protein [Anaerolineae bacterium]
KKNRGGRAPKSFLLRAALACLIAAATFFGSVSAARADVKIVVAGSANGNTNYGVARYNSDGNPDTSFDTDGKVTTDVSSLTDIAYGVAIQTDGKIVAVGAAQGVESVDFAVVRYTSNGTLDTTFGNGGKVITDIAGYQDQANAVAIQDDGKIVVAGWARMDSVIMDYDFVVVRYDTDGSLDPSFGTGGIVTTYFGIDDYSQGNAVAIQDDGKIVVAGLTVGFGRDFAVVRYTSNGTLDTSFGSGGKQTTDFGLDQDIAYAVAIQDDGKIVVAGSASVGNQSWAVARYNASGGLDTSFGSSGRVVVDFSGSTAEEARGVAIQDDGKIVAAGFTHEGILPGYDRFAVARCETDGSPDTSFDTDGKATTDFGATTNAKGQAVALQPDGKIVVAGYVEGANSNFAVVRYTSNGTLDTSFDTDGKVTTDFTGISDYGYAVVLQTLGQTLSTSTTASTITVESPQAKLVFDAAKGAGLNQLYGKTEANPSTGRGNAANYNLWSTQVWDTDWRYENGSGTLTLLESSPARVKIRQEYDYTSSIHLDRLWTIYPSKTTSDPVPTYLKVAIEEELTFDSAQSILGATGLHANNAFFSAGLSDGPNKIWLVTDNDPAYSDILGIPYTQPFFGRNSSPSWEAASESGTYYARVEEDSFVSTSAGSDTRYYLLYPYLPGLTTSPTNWEPYAKDYRNPSPLDTFNSGSGGWFDASENTSSGSGASWWDQSWTRRRKITFNNVVPGQNLFNFPVLIKLDSSRIDYAKTKTLGEDIRFVDADGTTVLSHEIEKWDEAGTSYVWVKVPQIDGPSNTDYIWMYYGADASDGQNPNGVWSNGYVGVWHLKEDPSGTPPQMKDSTNANHATSYGTNQV